MRVFVSLVGDFYWHPGVDLATDDLDLYYLGLGSKISTRGQADTKIFHVGDAKKGESERASCIAS